MFNRMLLTTVELALIIAVSIAVLLFLYVVFGGAVKSSFEKIKQLGPKKIKKENVEEPVAENVEEKKEQKVENNVYEAILEKVHQNRQQYYSDQEVEAEIAQKQNIGFENDTNVEEMPLQKQVDFSENFVNKLEEDFGEADFEELDFEDIDFNADNFNFDYSEDENIADIDVLKAQMRRKRMLKRTGTINSEISRCSDRIKAMLILDVLNKRLF